MQHDPALHQLVMLVAREHGLRATYDTHYDAFNWQISWCEGNDLHAVNVQPYPDGAVELSRVRTRLPLLPRLLAWAMRVVPMLLRWRRTTHEPLARFAWPAESARLREAIVSELPRMR